MMQVKTEVQNRTLTICIEGEIDHHTAHSLMQRIAQEMERSTPMTVILNCAGVTFMDSSGIAVALHTKKCMKQLGGNMRIEQCPPQAEKVFRAAGIEPQTRKESNK